MGEWENQEAPVDLPIVCYKVAEMTAAAGFDDFVAGGAKAKSPPMLVLFNLNGAANPLSVYSKAS
ncbi:hypothetical protein CRG98_048765, partial [Punica granatum]